MNVKDYDRRDALAQSKTLQEQVNKQTEETTLAKEQEKVSREARYKMQKLNEEARKDAQALPRIMARVTALEKDREKSLTDKQAIANEKEELFRVMKTKDEVINALQKVTKKWKQSMDDMKTDTIKSRTMEEMLTQENRLLKQREGEDEEV